MTTKKMAGYVTLLSSVISLFGMGIASAQSACIYGSNGQQFCPISSSTFYNGVNAGVQSNAISALGGLSNLSTLFVTALFVLLIIALVYIIAVRLILPFLK